MDKGKEKKEKQKTEVSSVEKTEKVPVEAKTKKEEKVEVKEVKKEVKVPAKEFLGEVNIVPEVIATIISRTVISIDGVAGLATHAKGGIGTLLGTKELEKGIKVDLKENKEVSTTISVILEYGSIIIQVAREIQKKVKEELENKTGLKVTSVNVNIQGVHIEEKK
ncbi:MAG: Asp23/Gls24 family envelope stress response protein [Candidatus Atribacteria bacterium]|nr:Asp23/Gls24 family envelope stress response protein [Candidatus Atribacteria bacterium]MCK4308736.1 Asp23/Gls24 family envelope stress response protein [Candidatus Atribacteria bacterium]